jgi:glycosyltransferase involved in cell wall biosynthesis
MTRANHVRRAFAAVHRNLNFTGVPGASPVPVLVAAPYFVPRIGGGESQLYQLARGLAAKGHAITILTLRLPGTQEDEDLGYARVLRFGDATTPAGRRAGLDGMRQFVAEHGRADAVFYEHLTVGATFPTDLMCKIARAAAGVGMRCVLRIMSSGRVRELAALYPPGLAQLRSADAVIALNPGIAQELAAYGVVPERIVSMPNGVDPDLFCPLNPDAVYRLRDQVGCAHSATVFLCPSRFARKKRVPDLVRLWHAVVGSDPAFALWLVGTDSLEETRGDVARAVVECIRDLRLDNVRLWGAVPHAEMPPFYQMADVYCSMSTQEGMSNAMLEAMASALPVMVPRCDATSPLIIDGWNGFLFDDAQGLCSAAEAMQRCLDERSSWATMGRRSRDWVCQNARLDSIVASYSLLFNSLLGRGDGPGTPPEERE